jgi:hypothetical protein
MGKTLLYEISVRREEDEMGEACSTNEGEEERVQVIGGKARRNEATRKTKT